jgi:hypothetical protein
MKDVQKKFEEFKGPRLEKINATLAAAKVEPIKIVTEEEFRKDDKSGPSGGTGQEWKMFFGITNLSPF